MGVVAENKRHSVFAGELQAALERSHMHAQDVVQQLSNYGHAIPMKTFLYWLDGYFLPRHDDAFALVETLERIFGMRDSSLRHALVADLSSGKSFVPEEYKVAQGVALPNKVGDDREKYLEVSDSQTDWDEEIIREVVHDGIIINAERNYIRHRTTIFGRIPSASAAFLNFPIIYEEKEEKPETEKMLYGIYGGKIVEQTTHEEGDILTVNTRLALSSEAISGALHQISFTSDFRTTNCFTRAVERFFSFPLAFYSCSVTFEGDVPDNIEYVFSISDEDNDTEENVSIMPLIPIENTVRVSLGDVLGATGYVRWK